MGGGGGARRDWNVSVVQYMGLVTSTAGGWMLRNSILIMFTFSVTCSVSKKQQPQVAKNVLLQLIKIVHPVCFLFLTF